MKPTPPIVLCSADGVTLHASLARARLAVNGGHLEPGGAAFDARGYPLTLTVGARDDVRLELAPGSLARPEALRERLVGWLARTPARRPDDTTAPLPELLRRVGAQQRRRARRTPRDLALALPSLALWLLTALALTWLFHGLHALRHGPLPYPVFRGEASGFLIFLPGLLAAAPLGFLEVNLIVHAIRPLGRLYERDAQLGEHPGYADAQRGLLRAARVLLAVALPLMLLGALLPFG